MTKTKQVTEKTTDQEKKEFNLEQVFAMWKETAKSGTTYFTGYYKGQSLRGFYNTEKKNPNEPDVKIYTTNDEGKLSKEPLLSLWCNATDEGKKYLSGKLKDNRVVGFINEKANAENRQPYFSVYYSDDKERPEEKPEEKEKQKKKPQKEEIKDKKLPF